MGTFRRVAIAAGIASLGAVGVFGLATEGCGGSTSGTGPIGPGDGAVGDATMDVAEEPTGADGTIDVSMPPDTGGDAQDASMGTIGDGAADVALDALEAGPSDAGPDGDAGVSDAPVDVAADSADAGLDAPFDASDSGPDAAQSLLAATFAQNLAQAICQAELSCCRTDQGGTYNLEACKETFVTRGWEANLPATEQVYNRPYLTVNETKALQCLTAVQNFPCPPGTPQTAAAWQAITNACELVIQGTIPVGSGGCMSSFECAPDAYCDPTLDGGLCTALSARGQPCNTKVTSYLEPSANLMCSYLASGKQALYCDLLSAPDSGTFGTCQPDRASGQSCCNPTADTSSPLYGYYDDLACTAGLCGDSCNCGDTASYPYAGFCSFYEILDAGGGG